ncbi:MAG TPA: hypothetical protein VE031_06780 [Chthoniobacterales bacterium]|nr:hypothetical protein [Chthoniobacterales bacterium]
MKLSLQLLPFAFLTTVCSLAATHTVLAQSSLLETNRNLRSNGPAASPPGARRERRLPVEAIASIDFGNNQSVTAICHKGSFDRVGLGHDQTVEITVQYSTADAGQGITVEALDGGAIVAPAKNLIVAADGTIHFKFRAGHQPGVYQIALGNGVQELGLQFWVLDEEHPANNPRVVNQGN